MDQREKERREEGRGEPAAASIGHPEWPDRIKRKFPAENERFSPQATAFRRRLCVKARAIQSSDGVKEKREKRKPGQVDYPIPCSATGKRRKNERCLDEHLTAVIPSSPENRVIYVLPARFF